MVLVQAAVREAFPYDFVEETAERNRDKNLAVSDSEEEAVVEYQGTRLLHVSEIADHSRSCRSTNQDCTKE